MAGIALCYAYQPDPKRELSDASNSKHRIAKVKESCYGSLCASDNRTHLRDGQTKTRLLGVVQRASDLCSELSKSPTQRSCNKPRLIIAY